MKDGKEVIITNRNKGKSESADLETSRSHIIVEIIEYMTGYQGYGPQKKCLQVHWVKFESVSIFSWVRAEKQNSFLLLPLPPESRLSC